MVGAYDITVSNRFLKYEFTIRRNITVIKGNSATGKTTLLELIREYNEQEDSGITIQSEKPCIVIYGKNWKEQLEKTSGCIVFIDEVGRFTKSEEFSKAIKGTDNYYVIVSREKLENLPFSIDEIYGIRESGKYNSLKAQYTLNEFYHIYGKNPEEQFKPEIVITEDTNSGYEFWRNVCRKEKIACEASGGKSVVLKKLKEYQAERRNKLVIVDGAAFGSEMETLMQYIRYFDKETKLYAPESFEYLILCSKLFPSGEIKERLSKTYQYADSKEYFSWERYYTKLLTQETKDTEKRYQKAHLNKYYLSEKSCAFILEAVPKNIIFTIPQASSV